MVKDSHSAILTFDDGGVSAWEHAAPLLERNGYRGFFLVCTGLVGSPGYINREQLRDLSRRGHVIGSHTVNHPILTLLSDQELTKELQDSRQWLEDLLGTECSTFAIPGGFVDRRVWKKIKESNYKIVFTSDIPLPVGAFDESRIARWHVKPWWSEDILKSVYCGRLFTIGPLVLRQQILELPKRILGYERYVKVSKTAKKYITSQPG